METIDQIKAEVHDLDTRIRNVELLSVETKGRVDAMADSIEEAVKNVGKNADKLDHLTTEVSKNTVETAKVQTRMDTNSRGTNLIISLVGIGLAALTIWLSI